MNINFITINITNGYENNSISYDLKNVQNGNKSDPLCDVIDFSHQENLKPNKT